MPVQPSIWDHYHGTASEAVDRINCCHSELTFSYSILISVKQSDFASSDLRGVLFSGIRNLPLKADHMDIYEFHPTGGISCAQAPQVHPELYAITWYAITCFFVSGRSIPQPTRLKHFMLKVVISKSFRRKHQRFSRLSSATSEITWYWSKPSDRLTVQGGKTRGTE